MKEYAYDHLKLMMCDKAATVIQAMIRGHIARIQHQKLKVQFNLIHIDLIYFGI